MRRRTIVWISAFLIVSLLIFILNAGTRRQVIRQPIDFPHRVHVDKQIDCSFCHDLAERSTAAGIPGVTQCMVCHQSIKTESPEVQKIAGFASRKEEIPWVRVYAFQSQAGVYFSHKRHIKAGIECVHCHGNVAGLKEMVREIRWNMGKCIDCHRERNAKTDCLTCHK